MLVTKEDTTTQKSEPIVKEKVSIEKIVIVSKVLKADRPKIKSNWKKLLTDKERKATERNIVPYVVLV